MWQRMVGLRLHLCWIRPRFIDTVVDTQPMVKEVRKPCRNEQYQNMLLQQKNEENLEKISKGCDHTVLHQLPGMMVVFIFSLIGKSYSLNHITVIVVPVLGVSFLWRNHVQAQSSLQRVPNQRLSLLQCPIRSVLKLRGCAVSCFC